MAPTAADAVADIPNGASIAVGGFGLAGIPWILINALPEQGASNLGPSKLTGMCSRLMTVGADLMLRFVSAAAGR